MQIWIVSKQHRDQIPWWRVHLYLAGTVIMFGFGASMGVLYTRAKLIDSKLKDRTDYITTIATLEQENQDLRVEINTLARDYMDSIIRNGEQR